MIADTVVASSRTLFISGGIDDSTSLQVMAEIHALSDVLAPITIYLNSAGGDEDSGYAIYDCLKSTRSPVTIVGIGAVKSIAVVIFSAGDTRLLTPETSCLIHNGTVVGQNEMLADYAISLGRETERQNEKYARILSKASGQTLKRVREWCRTEFSFTAQQAVRLGFADKVLTLR